MKTPDTVSAAIERRLMATWHTHLDGVGTAFPHRFPLGRVSSDMLRCEMPQVVHWSLSWHEWAQTYGADLDFATRNVAGGSRQRIPTHVTVTSADRAAAIVGTPWPHRLELGRRRMAELSARFPQVPNREALARIIDSYSPTDFDLLMDVADWFTSNPTGARNLTPRQVPIPGVHAKWMNQHQDLVQRLTGIEDLGLLPNHPSRIHFTYLDPVHRGAGGRVHDSATVGDIFTPEYIPHVVVISENKDTAINFPELEGGICVEGNGRGGKAAASFPWLRHAKHVIYWGDIDRDGYEILSGYRGDFDRELDSILMDQQTYDEFEPFGTSGGRKGQVLVAGAPRDVEHLKPREAEVYHRLIDESHKGHRRIEQERIPLHRALQAVQNLL